MSDEKKGIASYFTKKVIAGLSALAALFAIVGGIWAFEVHYATNKRVDDVVLVAKSDIVNLETQVAGALKQQQIKSDIQFYSFMLEKLTQEKNAIRRQMNQYPNDQSLKNDYQEIINEINRVRKLLDEAMRKMG